MSKSALHRIRRLGVTGVCAAALRRASRAFHIVRTIGAEQYRNPDESELASIESALAEEGIPCCDYYVDRSAFERFQARAQFPADYPGPAKSWIYEEKLLEHFVAWDLLDLRTAGKRYLDIAGASSPWAGRLTAMGVTAFSVDLDVPEHLAALGNYLREDATATRFPDDYFHAASAQCAYEMFTGRSDIDLLVELSRILKTGGRAVIAPLYMHTHACFYQTPDYYGKAHGDEHAKAYLRRDSWGIRASRKYSARTLRVRVCETARLHGLTPSIHVLRNKKEISNTVYLHFILVLDKPHVPRLDQ